MVQIPLKYNWNRQPQFIASPDSGNPLTRGLVALFIRDGTNTMYDAVNKALPSVRTETRRMGRNGVYSEFDATNKIEFPNNIKYYTDTALSICVGFDIDTLGSYSAILAYQDTSTTGGYELRLGNNPTESNVLLHRATASTYNQHYTAADKFTAGTKDNFLAIVTPDIVIENDPTFLNANGVITTSFTSLANDVGSMSAPATGTMHIGRRYDDVTKFDGAISFIAIHNRELSVAETEEIRKNPYQLLQPQIRLIDIPVVAGGASAALTTNVGTSATGTVGLSVAVALTGVLSTGSIGTLSPNIGADVSGVSSTSLVGTVSNSTSIPVTGESSTSAVGSVVLLDGTEALTSVLSTSSVGSVTPSITKSLSGENSTSSVGTLAPNLQLSLSGESVTTSVGSLNFTKSGSISISSVSLTASVGTITTSGGVRALTQWAESSNTSTAWTETTDNTETWTPTSDNSITWTEQ